MEKRLNAEVYIKELETEIVKLKQKIDDLVGQGCTERCVC